jgi:hypothetical protein
MPRGRTAQVLPGLLRELDRAARRDPQQALTAAACGRLLWLVRLWALVAYVMARLSWILIVYVTMVWLCLDGVNSVVLLLYSRLV